MSMIPLLFASGLLQHRQVAGEVSNPPGAEPPSRRGSSATSPETPPTGQRDHSPTGAGMKLTIKSPRGKNIFPESCYVIKTPLQDEGLNDYDMDG